MVRWLRQHLDRRTVGILLGLVAVALALDFLFYTGFYASDDLQYIESSRSIAVDGSLGTGIGSTRIGVALPGAVVWKITGGSLSALIWFHCAYHLALVPIAYVLARLIHSERAGLLAAALVAINPLFYVYAGAVLPDNAATCCVGLALIALVATRRSTDQAAWWNTRRFVGYAIAGAMVGFCYWCKETALILTVPSAVFLIAAAPSVRSLVWIGNGAAFTLGLVLVFVLELVVLHALTGEWINRLTYISDASDELRVIMQDEGTTPFARVGFAVEQITRFMPIATWLLFAGALAYSLTRARDLGIMMFFWFPMIYLTVGSTSLSTWLPPPIQGRYYTIAILPAIAMTSVVASHLLDRWRERSPRAQIGAAVFATFVLVGIYECRAALPAGGTIYRASDVQAFLTALDRAGDRYPDYPIVASPYYAGRLEPLFWERTDVTLDGSMPRPQPPYVYIRKVAETEIPDPDPIVPATQRIAAIEVVAPPKNRWNALVRRFGGSASSGPSYWWAELLVVEAKR